MGNRGGEIEVDAGTPHVTALSFPKTAYDELVAFPIPQKMLCTYSRLSPKMVSVPPRVGLLIMLTLVITGAAVKQK